MCSKRLLVNSRILLVSLVHLLVNLRRLLVSLVRLLVSYTFYSWIRDLGIGLVDKKTP
ncbi:hypothetical protein SB775_03940 [Peribacillus sp. SIMBA_075]